MQMMRNRMKYNLFFSLIMALFFSSSAMAVKFRLPLQADDTQNNGFYVGAYYNHHWQGVRDFSCKTRTYSTKTYAHAGIDYVLQALPGSTSWKDFLKGRDIVAAADGVVVSTADGYFDQCGGGFCDGATAFGNYVRILHNDGNYTYYAHMKKGSVAVSMGDNVTCGQVIGKIGSSGNSTAPHLHFEVRSSADDGNPNDGKPKSIDPYEGPCSDTPETLWTAQGEYDGFPAAQCEGEGNYTPFPPRYIKNKAIFTDKKIKDYTSFTRDTPFVQELTFRNEGNIIWTKAKGYALHFSYGENFTQGNLQVIELPDDTEVYPGGSVTLSIPMKAPSQAGLHKSYWIWQYQEQSFEAVAYTIIRVDAPSNNAWLRSTEYSVAAVFPGEKVTVKMTFENSGNTVWKQSESYQLQRNSSKMFNGPDKALLSYSDSIYPKDTKTFVLHLSVPENAPYGSRTEYWQMSQNGVMFGFKTPITIQVLRYEDKYLLLDENQKSDPKYLPGHVFEKTWTLKNTGNTTWTNAYKVSFFSGDDLLADAHDVPVFGTVKPGESHTFIVDMSAPNSSGIRQGIWKLKNSKGESFGKNLYAQINVSKPYDNASYVSETIPDYTVYSAGQTFQKTWTLKNDGNISWNDSYTLAYYSENSFNAQPLNIPVSQEVKPGESYTFSVNLTVPNSSGYKRGYWRMKSSSTGAWFGNKVWVIITVK